MNLIMENWRRHLKGKEIPEPGDQADGPTDEDRKIAKFFFSGAEEDDSNTGQAIFLAQDLDPGMAVDDIVKWGKAAREIIDIGLFLPIDGESEKEAKRSNNRKKFLRLKQLEKELWEITDRLISIVESDPDLSRADLWKHQTKRNRLQAMIIRAPMAAHEARKRRPVGSPHSPNNYGQGEWFEFLRAIVPD